MAASLRSFVSSHLLTHLQVSDSSLISYFITLASSSKSPSKLYTNLLSQGLPSSPESEAFAKDLWERANANKLGTLGKNVREERKKEQEESKDLRKQKWSMIDDPTEEDNRAVKDSGKKKEKGEKHLRKRKTSIGASDEEDEKERDSKRLRRERGRSRTPPPDEETSGSKHEVEEDPEAARLRDIRERDELAERLKQKDKSSTKKSKTIVTDTTKDSTVLDMSDAHLVKDLRLTSRQAYLGKREQQQLDLLKLEIADNERDFRGAKLTKREIRELEAKKELLRLAEEKNRIDDGTDGYFIPDADLDAQGKVGPLSLFLL
jgi:pre-mRNA-splicing factor ATP-dependent RNA helicase DHX16